MNAVVQDLPHVAAPAERRPAHGHIRVDAVSIELGEAAHRFTALDAVSIDVAPGEFVCLLGPSGCGKSTLLGALAGHLRPTSGTLTLDGQRIGGPDPRRGLVFQHHTLFPWLSVRDNVAYGLKMRRVPRAERLARADAILELVGLKGFEHRYPKALSGGMQQRVEIARVLVNEPRVLLMDEPFGALDALTRLKMQEMLLALWARSGTSIVFVTHDIDEALFMADRILVMSPRPGRIIDEIRVDATRPRQADWLTSEAFARLKRHCLDLLRDPAGALPLARLDPLSGLPREPAGSASHHLPPSSAI